MECVSLSAMSLVGNQQHVKLIPLALMPFGRAMVDAD
jgi:uncharacterized membrane protein YccF (DUF307 family)